jgi:hypothetical protein
MTGYRVLRLCMIALMFGVAFGAQAQRHEGELGGTSRAEERKLQRLAEEEEPMFTPADKRTFKKWLTDNTGHLPAALTKRERITPAAARQLKYKAKLSPDLLQKARALPLELDLKLTKLPFGYQRLIVGDDLVLIHNNTSLIYDVVPGAIP